MTLVSATCMPKVVMGEAELPVLRIADLSLRLAERHDASPDRKRGSERLPSLALRASVGRVASGAFLGRVRYRMAQEGHVVEPKELSVTISQTLVEHVSTIARSCGMQVALTNVI